MSAEIQLENIEDGDVVRAFLPIKESKEKFRSNCTFQFIKANSFHLNFADEVLPADELLLKKAAIITFNIAGTSTSLEAVITEVVSDNCILMEMVTVFSHEQLREFFRVDAITEVITKGFPSTLSNKKKEGWIIQGKTLDISGNGILAIFPDRIPKNEIIILKIVLPNENQETISLTATEVRSQRLDDNKWEIALRFENVQTEDRDKIIGCCLNIQRKMLQLKVRVRS
ncbi:MAG: PilZ domain-containing protein [Desulfotalea sp.]